MTTITSATILKYEQGSGYHYLARATVQYDTHSSGTTIKARTKDEAISHLEQALTELLSQPA